MVRFDKSRPRPDVRPEDGAAARLRERRPPLKHDPLGGFTWMGEPMPRFVPLALVVLGVVGGVAAGIGLAAGFANDGSRNWLQFAVWLVWTPTMVLVARRSPRLRRLAWPFGITGLGLVAFYATGGVASPLLDGSAGWMFIGAVGVGVVWLIIGLWWARRSRASAGVVGRESA